MSQQSNYWFPAKKYGWGWGLPVAWQGWAVMLVFIALLVGGGWMLIPHYPAWLFLAYAALVCVAMLTICWLKGAPAKWRWGEK